MSFTETNECGQCGAHVPVEKAFCPNCSEPMEPEEAPNRAASMSSEMMSTIRDDPEGYREVLSEVKKHKQAAAAERVEIAAAAERERMGLAQGPAHAAPSVTGYSFPQPADLVAPPAKSRKGFLIAGIGAALLVILLVALFALKII